jgi:MFS family permease
MTPTAAPKPTLTTRQMYRSLLFSVYLPSFLMSICQGSVLLVIPLFALDMGASAGVAAIVFAMRGLGNMAADIPAGYASSRLGDKYTMLAGIGLMIVSGLLASQATTPLALGAAAFSFGAAMATWLLSRLTHISEAVPAHQRGKAVSSMAGLQRFGNLLGPVASGLIASQFGFSWVFVIVSLIAALSFVLIVFSVKDNKTGHHAESPSMLALLPHIIGAHKQVFMTAGLAVLCLTILRAGRTLLIPLWGGTLGLSVSDIGFIVGAAAAVDMALFPLAGYLMDSWGRKYAGISCLTIMALGLFIVPFADSMPTLLLAAMLAGLGNGLGSGINMTLGADFAPPTERGEFLGVWRLMSDLGSFGGPLAMGYVASAFALGTAFTLTAGLGVVGALIMLLAVKETLQKPPP